MFQHLTALPETEHTRSLDPISALKPFRGFSPSVLAHVSQMGVGVWNACGIAAMLMMLRDCGLALTATVNYWSHVIDAQQDGTTVSNLRDMALQLGGHPESGANTPAPWIQLVRYSALPREFQNVAYLGGTFLHWIVRENDSYYDPLQPQGAGGPFKSSAAYLDSIDIDPAQRVGLTDPRIMDSLHDGIPFDVDIAALSWRVRKTPSATGETLGVVTQGQRVHVLGTTTINGVRYDAVQRSVGGADLSTIDESTLNTGDKSIAYLKEGTGVKKI